MKKLERFSDMIAENENIGQQCSKCRSILIPSHLLNEGIGAYASCIPYLYCEECELLYVSNGGENDGH